MTMNRIAVLWRGSEGVPGVAEAVKVIKAAGKRIYYVVRCVDLVAALERPRDDASPNNNSTNSLL